MARVSHGAAASYGNLKSLESASIDLETLLYRLQQTVLHPDPQRERLLRTSEYERTRVGSNLEYARNALTKLELEATTIAPARRVEFQDKLNKQREILELLLDRLQDLRLIAVDDEDFSSDEEDLLKDIGRTHGEGIDPSLGHLDNSTVNRKDIEIEKSEPPASSPEPAVPEPILPSQPTTQPAPTQTSQTLRVRPTATAAASAITQPAPSPSTPPAHTSARAALFASRQKPAAPQTSTATAEAILDHQRTEQDALSESILKMASALKASSHKFSDTLEADKEVVGRAGDGMEKTERGMDAARGRMGALRRMTEGKGWLGRIMLYAWVYGLMLALVFLVFVLPKLRF